MLILIIAILLPIQFPAHVPGKAKEDGISATHMGDEDMVAGSWLFPGQVLWSSGVMEDFSLLNSTFQVNE